MADITVAQLAAKIPAGDSVKTWWEDAADLPVDAPLNEFLAKTLKAAYEAAVAANANLAAGSRIDGYPEPINGAVTTDPETGIMAFISTLSVRTLVPVNFNSNISPLV
ncbi:MAG: hypothetical protein N3E45_17120 [Oscillatoriaceae bacterium SKW80]|nr:hypothetical protein [Oscillatoriaceae bacterium SKW80]HIK27957.1 hypothetical protein [Oscillatoriaceae cyanobacterium M7585_C2015_266]